MAGSSFLLARSPVTPNMTSTHGPATRGILRSRGSRSGFGGGSGLICGLPGELVLDGPQQLVPGRGELLDAFALQYLDHVVVADAELLKVGEDLAGLLIGAVHRVAVQLGMISGGVDGGLRARVHGVG